MNKSLQIEALLMNVVHRNTNWDDQYKSYKILEEKFGLKEETVNVLGELKYHGYWSSKNGPLGPYFSEVDHQFSHLTKTDRTSNEF